jgi:serine/threonine-protein kinase OSR1/STK39
VAALQVYLLFLSSMTLRSVLIPRSDNSTDYTLGQPIGFGASSIVYQAVYHPRPTVLQPVSTPIPCALKVLDLDSLPPDSLRLLQQETTLMSLSKHPNVLRVRGSWMDGHKLYIAMRLMNKGSAADVMRYGWPGGMEEEVVRCILKQALEGLKSVSRASLSFSFLRLIDTTNSYLHVNGFIHRDVKAANLLIDDDGTVLLGDLGVAASLVETASPSNASRPNTFVPPIRPKMGKRKSFVGTVISSLDHFIPFICSSSYRAALLDVSRVNSRAAV